MAKESQSSHKYEVWVAGVTGAIVAAIFDFFVIRQIMNGLEIELKTVKEILGEQ